MIDDAFLRQVAALQANLKMLESQSDTLSDLADIKELRLYKARLSDYIEAHVRAKHLPRDPFQVIEQRLIALSEFFTAADQEYQRLKGWKADWLNSLPAVGLADLQSARTELTEWIAEVQHTQERLAQRLSPLDWDTSSPSVDLHADLMACAQCVSGLKLPKKSKKREGFYQFTRGKGRLAKKTSTHLTAMGMRIEELIALHSNHLKSVADIIRQTLKKISAGTIVDIDYSGPKLGIDEQLALFRRLSELDASLDDRLGSAELKAVRRELEELRNLVQSNDSELGQKCLSALKGCELQTPIFAAGWTSGPSRRFFVRIAALFSNLAKLDLARERNLEIFVQKQQALETKIDRGLVGAFVGMPLPGKAIMNFIFCPAGKFTMGSPSLEHGRGSDEDQVEISITKGFWMAKTEVTQAQWFAVMAGNPSSFKGDDLPVTNVSWHDVTKFIDKVKGCGVMPKGWKLTMPTEAQWEYACRAGAAGPYSSGSIDKVAWYHKNSATKTHSVGTKKPNTWGLHDMHGNVWEWCADWYGDTLVGGTDPSGPLSGVLRISRGGSWRDSATCCRAASRYRFYLDHRHSYLGFRPILVPSK